MVTPSQSCYVLDCDRPCLTSVEEDTPNTRIVCIASVTQGDASTSENGKEFPELLPRRSYSSSRSIIATTPLTSDITKVAKSADYFKLLTI